MPVPTTRYPNIVRAVYSRPWAIEPGTLALVLDILRFRVEGGRFTPEEIEERIAGAEHGPRANQTYAASRSRGAGGRREGPAPALIPVYGVISQRQGLMAADSGGTSIEGLTQDFRAAMGDPEVSGIIFEFDSPGGTIDGVDELATEIRQARGQKPIVAVANSMAASAAYWLASAADEVVTIPSGSVGSIGVFAAHEDQSVKAEAEGVRTTLISAGKYKTEGNPWEPLGTEARAHLQEMVDAHYGMMVSAIAKGRGVSVEHVRSQMGEGRLVLPKNAKAAGMVDRIDTLDHTISRVARGAIASRSSSVAARGGYRLAAVDDDIDIDDVADDELVTARSFSDRLALVTAQAGSLVEHAQDRAAMRALKGRALSPDDRAGLREIATSLTELAGDEPEPDPAPEPPSPPPPGLSPKRRVALALARAQYDLH
jgi:capsid assembly protease